MPHRRIWVVASVSVVLLASAARAQQPEQPAPPMAHGTHHAAPHAAPSTPAGGHHMTAAAAAAPADVASPDALLAAFYESISGPPGKPRDRNRFVSLFFPGARLLPAEGKGHSGTMPMDYTPETFLYGTQAAMVGDGFVEREVARRSERFGKVLQVFSTYEARHAATDPKPFVRGVNGFQLVFDGRRWWIFSLLWQPETAKLALPDELLRPPTGP
jgi:hypothetical protein